MGLIEKAKQCTVRTKIFLLAGTLLLVFIIVGLTSTLRVVYQTETLAYITDNLSIAHITDTHFTNHYNESMYEEITTEINDRDADILLFTGDLFQTNNIDLALEEEVTLILSEMDATYKLAVLGNHDFYLDSKTEITIRVLENAGFTVLQNEDVVLEVNDVDYHFIGLDDLGYGMNNYEPLLQTTTNYENNIVLSHEPDTFDEIKEYDVLAVFCGHSHGGQFRLPLIGHIIMVPGARDYPLHHYDSKDTELFTSFGCGESIIPFRFYNPRYINFYTNS